MADINGFIDALGDDISDAFAPKIEEEILQIGNEIANQATPAVQDFSDQLIKVIADQTTPLVRDFANKLVKDIFAQQSATIRDFVIGLIKDLVGRYDPVLTGKLNTRIVDQGIEIVSDDTKLKMKQRGTNNVIAELDLPINFQIEIKDIFVKLDTAVKLEDVQL